VVGDWEGYEKYGEGVFFFKRPMDRMEFNWSLFTAETAVIHRAVRYCRGKRRIQAPRVLVSSVS